ncbi:DNA polymerase III subunit gamma and tau [Dactylosporangium sp. AC04546]|uniref:DNA polymerase III subunit gamma and tau n=1 Tax=Dactylosporangium sp. AC04546 TaxID=2862460 RepID=UPI002E7C4D87|nr:DNA polymerase III subunit gamma and tau [Dactylosporangium sp. AC04546]WVK83469.1 DNA polymerase III subunit gamma and tau [Dactylosporangium sp. AC04546]
MALALYRKYRPRTFAEVIGQEHVTEPLSQALRSGRLNHAYLFSGPRGCGKTSSARILARSLNCEQGPTPEPCGVCQSCRDLAPDGSGSIDVIEIDAASHGGVDDARDLRERAIFAPVSSRFKVYVIDEAHMVSSAGFNALLKLVEEPPDYVKFVFATTEPEKVLGTIKSRTHHYPFRLIPPGVLRPYLEQLTSAEGVKVEPAVFPLVVRAGAGSARDTLSVLDQLIAGAGDEGVTYARAVALLGVTDVALLDEMCEALAADDGRGAYGVIDRVVEAGHDPRRFASDLLERLRDLIVLQQVPDAVDKGLLDAPHDQLERMGMQATQLGQATLSRLADIVHDGLTEMRGTTAPRLLLELITARMLLPGADDSSSALLQRLERMERRLMAGGVPAEAQQVVASAPSAPSASSTATSAGASAAPAAAPSPGVSPAPSGASEASSGASAAFSGPSGGSSAGPSAASPGAKAFDGAPSASGEPAPPPAVQTTPPASPPPPAAHGGGGLDASAVRRVWPDVLSRVSEKSKKAAAIVREATVHEVEGTTLVLTFKYVTHANMLSNSPEVLVGALQEVLGGRWQIRCEVGGQPGGGGGGRPASPNPTPQPPAQPAPQPTPQQTPQPVSQAVSQPSAPSAPRLAPSVPSQSAAPADASGWPSPAAPGGHGSSDRSSGSSSDQGAADDGWPTPAALGGQVPAQAPADSGWPTPAALGGRAQGTEDGGWPTPVTPGAAPARPAPTSPAPIGPVSTTTPAPTSPVSAGPVPTSSVPTSSAPVSSAPTSSASTGPVSASPMSARPAPTGPSTAGSVGVSPSAGVPSASPAPPARSAPGRSGGGRPRQGGSSAIEMAREAARAAAAGSGQRRASAAPAGAPVESAWDGVGADEPPFDPDYDSPVADPRFPGLDPGDELLDDATAVRESSEEAALRLLTEALGAEKIGETTA